MRKVSSDDRRTMYSVRLNPAVWRELNYVEAEPNQRMGGHYHKETVEFFQILEGEVTVVLEDINTGESNTFVADKNDCFTVYPFVEHVLVTHGVVKWVSLLSKEYDVLEPDIHLVRTVLSEKPHVL